MEVFQLPVLSNISKFRQNWKSKLNIGGNVRKISVCTSACTLAVAAALQIESQLQEGGTAHGLSHA